MRTASFTMARLPISLAFASLLVSSPGHAIDIEQRPLSTSPKPVLAAPAPSVKAAATAEATKSTPVASAAAINPAWDMFQQIEDMRSTIAKLQGSVEEQQQLIERLQSDLRARYTDLDQRLEQLNKPSTEASTSSTSEIAGNTPPATDATSAEAAPSPASTKVPEATANKVKAELTTEEIERQKLAYLAAYQSFRRDGAAPAITAMTDFLTRYPDSVFSPNAYYWLGEFQLALTPANYVKAEASFQRVLRDYSTSPKAASAYYKLGSIADLQGKRKEAREWMSKLLTQFPSSPEARLAQSFLDQNPAK